VDSIDGHFSQASPESAHSRRPARGSGRSATRRPVAVSRGRFSAVHPGAPTSIGACSVRFWNISAAPFTRAVYEPASRLADAKGFRSDVAREVKELGVPIIRYPGGNFVSGYNWLDGVGPKAQRPVVLDRAWNSLETNQFGTNEIIEWCGVVSAEPLLGMNFGTDTVEMAAAYVEYCNLDRARAGASPNDRTATTNRTMSATGRRADAQSRSRQRPRGRARVGRNRADARARLRDADRFRSEGGQHLRRSAAGSRMTFKLPPRSYTIAHLATRA
jgi:hypothetical protein